MSNKYIQELTVSIHDELKVCVQIAIRQAIKANRKSAEVDLYFKNDSTVKQYFKDQGFWFKHRPYVPGSRFNLSLPESMTINWGDKGD